MSTKRTEAGKIILSLLLWVWTGTIYFFGEVIWKTSQGRSDMISWTMFLLAIILAIPLERFGAELPWRMSLLLQALICGISITIVEFFSGCVLNLWLNLDIWDYSNLPYNILGQVCPQFAFLWFLLSIVGIIMLDWMRYAVEGGERPKYHLI
jgi:uncharacterized membrane protein